MTHLQPDHASNQRSTADPAKDTNGTHRQAEFRKLPAVDALLRLPTVAFLTAQYGQEQTVGAIRETLAAARQAIQAGGAAPPVDQLTAAICLHLDQVTQPTLQPVLNATGVIVHTNLGRAPLSVAALAAVTQVAQGYSNLEYDLTAGARGSRHDHARDLLATLTGAEDALVVNNNAAAIYLILATFCQGREVLVSRSQLVEIGGGFRIPDVLRQSGAKLVEVGTTNRTHAHDFADPITPETAALMRIHTSNFKQIGFTAMPTLAELTEIARAKGMLLIDDLGSGTLLDTAKYGLAAEPTVQASVAAGADLVTFSGDKLLGGPQAGIIVGRQELIAQLRRHPMARALRVDKLTYAALDATLRSYQRQQAPAEIPVWQMISATPEALWTRVMRWQQELARHHIESQLLDGESAVGGGSLPGETLPTVLLAIDHPQPDHVAEQLRQIKPQPNKSHVSTGDTLPTPSPVMSPTMPVICRIQQEQLLFDARTVLPGQGPLLLQRLVDIL